MFQNVAMTSHIGKKSGLVPAASVTAATPAPGKGTGHSPSPFYGGHMGPNPNLDPPPPFLFVDSLKPIEIVVSFTALSKWLDPPQPIIKERDKEKEKESNSVLTGQGMVVSLNYLFLFLSCSCQEPINRSLCRYHFLSVNLFMIRVIFRTSFYWRGFMGHRSSLIDYFSVIAEVVPRDLFQK